MNDPITPTSLPHRWDNSRARGAASHCTRTSRFFFGTRGTEPVQHGFCMVDDKAVVLQQVFPQLVQVITADVKQLPALGTLQVKMLRAGVGFSGEELIAGTAFSVQHIFSHNALFHQLLQCPVDRRRSHRCFVVLQMPHQFRYCDVPSRTVLQKCQNIFPLFRFICHNVVRVLPKAIPHKERLATLHGIALTTYQ